MLQLVFATNNQHKLEEVRDVLKYFATVLSLKDIGCYDDIPETATTLEGNALLKARHVYENYGYDCFADDTGLEVDALNGRPGVYSARYAGEDQNASKNIIKLLGEMEGVSQRSACFRTVVVLLEKGQPRYFEGKIEGQITMESAGMAGFGYDPVFVPDGFSQTFAELGSEQKNKISHRALAIKELKHYLTSR